MGKEYRGLKENLERFKNDLFDEKTRLLFSIAFKQGYDQAERGYINFYEYMDDHYTRVSDGFVTKKELGVSHPIISIEEALKEYYDTNNS